MSTILLKQKEYEELSQSIFDLNLKVMERDKEIERLNNDIKELLKENGNKEKVIKVQDNIMTELEIELYAKYHEHKDSECEELYAKAQEDKEILDYIKELKGADKE